MSTLRKRPRQQRSQETYDAILDAAAQLFERDGYTKATTNHIAERAGVSIGSLYQYFPNKDALLYGLGERHVVQILSMFTALSEHMRDTCPSLEESVRTLIMAISDLHDRDPQMHRIMYDLAPRTPETMQHLRNVQLMIAAEVEHHLKRLGTGGPDAGLTALLLVQGVEAQVHGALLEPPPGRTRDETMEAIVQLTLRSLRS